MRSCPSTGIACYAEVCKTWPCDISMRARCAAPDQRVASIAPDQVLETEEGLILSGSDEEEGRFEIEP